MSGRFYTPDSATGCCMTCKRTEAEHAPKAWTATPRSCPPEAARRCETDEVIGHETVVVDVDLLPPYNALLAMRLCACGEPIADHVRLDFSARATCTASAPADLLAGIDQALVSGAERTEVGPVAAARPAYAPDIEEILAVIPTITTAQWLELAVACADQAGVPLAAQDALRGAIQLVVGRRSGKTFAHLQAERVTLSGVLEAAGADPRLSLVEQAEQVRIALLAAQASAGEARSTAEDFNVQRVAAGSALAHLEALAVEWRAAARAVHVIERGDRSAARIGADRRTEPGHHDALVRLDAAERALAKSVPEVAT